MASNQLELNDPGTTGLLIDEEESQSCAHDQPSTVPEGDAMVAVARNPRETVRSGANIMAHVLSFAALLTVYRWIYSLGGLSWREGEAKVVFNWHPLLMVTAFCFMTVSTLSFRSPWMVLSRKARKTVHGLGWLIAAMSGFIGLIAVFKSHNDKSSGYIANMYSFHSWIGICVVFVYILQFLAGAYFFWWASNTTLKALALQVHVLVGPILYYSVSVTILLGIQEKEGFVGCSYAVNSVNLFPEISKIPDSCLVSHTLGLLVFFTTVCTFVALHHRTHEFPIAPSPSTND